MAQAHPFCKRLLCDIFSEGFLNVVTDDQDEPPNASADGVEDSIVDNGLVRGSDRIDFIKPAVPATHTGGQNKHSRFFHR